MKLILTRHGRTVENEKGILQGHQPGKLSKTGLEQAKKLALRLKSEKIDFIYSSDLARAADTTREIAKFHPKTPLFLVEELRESDLGSFSGKHREDIDWNNRPKDVESLSSMKKRVKKLLDDVYKKNPNSTVLFVGHNRINKVLITIIMNKPVKHMKNLEQQHNTTINIFEIKEDKKHKVILLNCKKHLE
ncbi:MAG: histidine phosphatase family protein [Nanoarchaeota archaeon]|nr:histidine phosphatase family protein [Nanoarchaeota archaeon]